MFLLTTKILWSLLSKGAKVYIAERLEEVPQRAIDELSVPLVPNRIQHSEIQPTRASTSK